MSTIKMAKSNEWFNDCSDDIRASCLRALDGLNKLYGWETVDVTLPDIEAIRLAHYVTIGSKCTASIAHHLDKMGRSESGWDVRVALSIYVELFLVGRERYSKISKRGRGGKIFYFTFRFFEGFHKL